MNTPDSLRYILWRYSQDHSGDDHQQRFHDAEAFLNQPPPISLQELHQLYTEAVKITRKERSMRNHVFRNDPDKLNAKIAECDRLEFILSTFKDALKPLAAPPTQPEQPPLLDIPKKADYP